MPIEPFGGVPRTVRSKASLPRRYGEVATTVRSPLCSDLSKAAVNVSEDEQTSASGYANTSTGTQQMNATKKRVSFEDETSDSDTSGEFD